MKVSRKADNQLSTMLLSQSHSQACQEWLQTFSYCEAYPQSAKNNKQKNKLRQNYGDSKKTNGG